MLERHARWVIRRRWWVVAGWIVLLVVGFMLASRIGDVTSSQVTLPGKESQRGIDLIQNKFGNGDSTSLQAVFRNPSATVNDPAYRAAVTAGLTRAAAVVPGTQVVDYFSSGSRDLVGDGGHLTYATLRLPISPEDAKDKVAPIREALGTPTGFEPTLVGGAAALDHDTTPIFNDDLKKAELIAFPLALLILLVVFGTRGQRAAAARHGDRDHHDGPRRDLSGGSGDDAGRLRDQRDHADRHRHRGGLLAADGLAIQGGAEGRATTGRRRSCGPWSRPAIR